MKATEVGKRDTPSRSAGFEVPARILHGSVPEMHVRQALEHIEIRPGERVWPHPWRTD